MQYQMNACGVDIRTGADVCSIECHAKSIVRIRYAFDGEVNHRVMQAVILPKQAAQFELEETAGGCMIRFESGVSVQVQETPFSLCIMDAQGRIVHRDLAGRAYGKDTNSRRFHYFERMGFTLFYGLGERSGKLNKAKRHLHIDCHDAMGYDSEYSDPLYKHIPFFIKRDPAQKLSCGVFYDSPYTGVFDFGCEHSNYWPHYGYFSCDGGEIDYYVIMGNSIREIVCRYTDLTGKTIMQPISTMGFMGSTMHYTEQESGVQEAIVGFVRKMHEHGLGCDGFHLSSGYSSIEGKRYVFNWNRNKFPDPAQFAQSMKEENALVSPNVKPAMLLNHPLYEAFQKENAFLMNEERTAPHEEMFWGGQASLVDFTSAAGRSLWKEHLIEAYLEKGITGIWDDNNEFEITSGNPVCFNEGDPMPVRGMRPLLSLLMARTALEAYQQYDPQLRPYVLSRAGYAGIQRYAQTWAGDNRTDWNSLRYNIPLMLGMGLSGVANQGCDVGGFDGPAPEGELFVRWVQNGIFQPRFCIHSQNDDHTVTLPWAYGKYLQQLQAAFGLRYQLSLYLYSLLWHAHRTGEPIMRPLVYAFENDPHVAEESFVFMEGPNLLVANVLDPGVKSMHIYLPAGVKWRSFRTHEIYEGGQEIEIEVTLDSIPLFYPQGCILPLVASALCARTENFAKVHLLMECSKASSFTLYQDDGASNRYLDGVYLETRISMALSEEAVTICFAHEGSFESVTEQYELTVVSLDTAPASVYVDDQALACCLDEEEYIASSDGFFYDLSTRHTFVKFPNPKRDFTLTIEKGRSIYGS